MRSTPARRRVALVVWAAALLCAPSWAASDGARLTGRDIYERVLDNRFASFVQDTTLISADRGGRNQTSQLRMIWRDFREGEASPVLSKTLVRYSHPFDIRFAGYLIIQKQGDSNEQFVYFPQRRKISRVHLRGQSIFGTDFSYEDIIPRELQDATYQRIDDETLDDRPVFVIEARPTPLANSQYGRFRIYVDQQRYVAMRTRYWDRAGVEVKEFRASTADVKQFDGIWVPLRATMYSHQLDSTTTLIISNLDPNPEIPDTTFDLRRLESH